MVGKKKGMHLTWIKIPSDAQDKEEKHVRHNVHIGLQASVQVTYNLHYMLHDMWPSKKKKNQSHPLLNYYCLISGIWL